MDETGYQLSAPGSVTVLVSRHDRTNSRGAVVKRESITVVECVCRRHSLTSNGYVARFDTSEFMDYPRDA